jgi:hypothetical protein
VKNSLRGAPVALGIVQHALAHAVRIDDVGRKLVLVGRQRQHASQPILVQDEAVARQFAGHRSVGQVIVKKIIDPPIDRAGVTGQQPILFAALGDERLQQGIQRGRSTGQGDADHPHLSQFQIDVSMEIGRIRRIQSNGTVHGLGVAGLG